MSVPKGHSSKVSSSKISSFKGSSHSASHFSSRFSSSNFTVDSLLDFIYSSSLLKDESFQIIIDGKPFKGSITFTKEKGLKKPFIVSLLSD